MGSSLPESAEGSVLFADISGFTPVTESLRMLLGSRRGAEALVTHLNRVYDALIAVVEWHSGSVISFAGDAALAQDLEDLQTARDLHEAALTMRREINKKRDLSQSLVYLAELELQLGRVEAAERCGAEALEILWQTQEWMLAPMLANIAAIQHIRGYLVAGVRQLLGEPMTLAAAIDTPRVKRLALFQASRLIEAYRHNDLLAELVGLVQAQDVPMEEQKQVHRLLEGLRTRMPVAHLDVALERGWVLTLEVLIGKTLELAQSTPE